jgi:hypothetical protein
MWYQKKVGDWFFPELLVSIAIEQTGAVDLYLGLDTWHPEVSCGLCQSF